MHPHFFHWHNRAELKPAVTVLEPRWNAAAKFAEDVSVSDICSLLRLVLFEGAEAQFAKRFSDALVQIEPTFPPEDNAELLRIMATAAVYSRMEEPSGTADAIALGLRAAAFPPERVRTVCKELMPRAEEYLGAECERMRPKISIDQHFEPLETAVSSPDWPSNPDATKLLGDAVVEMGNAIGRVSEENQFLWWLVGRRSPILDTRRDKLTPRAYALIAATEAAERVLSLPPAASVESLISEGLGQCSKSEDSAESLVKLLDATTGDEVNAPIVACTSNELVPITSMLAIRRAGGKTNAKALQQLHIPAKFKTVPAEVARQYFRELMFLRALSEMS